MFLIGAARSGTSLLYKALCLHPDVTYISNWVSRFPRAPALSALNRLPRSATGMRRAVWFQDDSNAYVYGRRRPLAHRLFPMPVEGEPLFAFCGLRPDPPLDDPVPGNSRLRRSLELLAAADGGRLLVSKRIDHNRRIPQLAAATPNARFVSIVRDGRAVAYSLSRVDWWADRVVWWCGQTPRSWEWEGRDPWELCARNWVEELTAIERGVAALPPVSVLSITYEQLVHSPIPTLLAVAEFAGLDRDARWMSELEGLRFPDRNELWRERLPLPAVERINAVQMPMLRRYGYEALAALGA